jgi:hypothetical protein
MKQILKSKVNNICVKTTILITLSLLCAINLKSQTADSISQYGITWKFDTTYMYGQFANGDYWVVGPVTITSITPDFTGTRNGWQVNITYNGTNPFTIPQAFDDRINNFNSSLVPSLPYLAAVGTSIVKTISNDIPQGTGSSCQVLKTAAVLTVLSEVPPDNGTTVFRPPYFGTAKPLISVNSLHPELLPSLAPIANTPTLATIAAGFQRVEIDYKEVVDGCMNPSDNMPGYGAYIAVHNGEGALRLMLNDPLEVKMTLLIYYVQYGIDLYYILISGGGWYDSGGHSVGRKLPVTFAAVMLDNQDMKNAVSSDSPSPPYSFTKFEENMGIVPNGNGLALFGHPFDEMDYWYNQVAGGPGGGTGDADTRDPYGYIDGGRVPGSYYQMCCLSQPWKCEALPVLLMPELKAVWNFQSFFDYVDRWVNFGTWTQPDPCAPQDGDWSHYGVTYGPDGHGGCIKDTNPADGIGRFPVLHGSNKDAQSHGSDWVTSMWTAYRADYGCVYIGVDTITHEKKYDCSQCKYNCTAPITKGDMMIPREFSVTQNYPNPFNPSTKIQFIVPSDGHVRIRVYNCLGQIVATPFEGEVNAGQYQTVQIDGTNLSSGVYFYSVEHRGQRIARQMVLIK